MHDLKPLIEFIKEQLPADLELLKQMVGINSFTTNKEGVEQLSQFTAETFAKLGFKAERVPSVRSDYGNHLVLTRPGKSSRTVGLISHLDTVYPAEEEVRNNFSWRQEGDRIYGPGTMDIKGGTVMIHLVLRALQKLSPEAFEEVTWVILLNSSEEVLSFDFGKLCLAKLGNNCLGALVFEAGAQNGDAFTFVTARKGRAVFRVNVDGRGAHAGAHHERGANAIVQLGETVQRIAELTNYKKELTFNIGTISGGTVINRVPHHAMADGEMRTFDMDIYREGLKELMQLNGRSTIRSVDDGHECQVKIEVTQESPPWPRNKGTENLFQIWQKAAAALNLKIMREERGGISDGNFICHAIPTIDGLGPNGDNAHCSEQSADGSKQQEFVDVSSFAPKAALNTLAILELIRQ